MEIINKLKECICGSKQPSYFSYDKDFMDIVFSYPEELLKMEGIATSQLDFNRSAKKYLKNSSATADVSVDGNANVDSKDVVGYTYELPKPLFKLNSLYILWEKLCEEESEEVAERIIRDQLEGSLYINDSSDLGKPYSYHPHTMIETHGEILSMEELFRRNDYRKDIYDDREVINLMESRQYVAGGSGGMASLLCVLRHKSHTDLLRIETKQGNVLVVTEDHPIILEDMSEIPASTLKLGDKLKEGKTQGFDFDYADMDERLDYYYLIGAMAGDGHTGKELGFTQKDVEGSHFYSKFMKYFPNATVVGTKKLLLNVDAPTKAEWTLKIGSGAKNKHLPYLGDNKVTQRQAEAMLCGLIDADGAVNKLTGVIDIRVTSYQLVQQIQSIAQSEHMDLKNCRVSLVKHSQSGFKSKLPMYRVSFSLPSAGMLSMSEKVRSAGAVVYKERKKDGRWEGTTVHKIEKIPYKGEWVYDIQTSTGNFSSNGILCHNCFNYSMYDIVMEGLPMIEKIKSGPPKSLYAFKSQVEQFIIIASNSTLGATGLADIFLCMGLYIDKIRRDGYKDHNIQLEASEDALTAYIDETVTSLVYTLNQPMRGNQSPFTNVSLFDREFLKDLCPDYRLVGETQSVSPETVMELQELYMKVMNREMKRTPITFPVTTPCFASKDGLITDGEFVKKVAEESVEWGFMNFYTGSTSTLSSCCRLRSDKSSEYFNSFGAGSTKIGSLGVVTLPLRRYAEEVRGDYDSFIEVLRYHAKQTVMINNAKRSIISSRIDRGNMPLYTHGVMDLSKQYSTIGITGFYEAMAYLGLDVAVDTEKCIAVLRELNMVCDEGSLLYKAPHNLEQVPAENSAIKLADKASYAGWNVDKIAFYSNQFIPATSPVDLLTRIRVQGELDSHFSGGSILHVNMERPIDDYKVYESLIHECAGNGVVYWAANYNIKECEDGHMFTGDICQCGKGAESTYTRVVGFLTKVANWAKVRREEDHPKRVRY